MDKRCEKKWITWTKNIIISFFIAVSHFCSSHYALMVIILQPFKLNTSPLFSAHLFVCICFSFLLPRNISPNSYTPLPPPLQLSSVFSSCKQFQQVYCMRYEPTLPPKGRRNWTKRRTTWKWLEKTHLSLCTWRSSQFIGKEFKLAEKRKPPLKTLLFN